MEVKSGRRRLARNRRRVGQTSTNSTGMTDNTFHLDQLFQRTEADIIILRTRPLSTDSATRSAQSVERRAMEVARSLSRIGTQLESLAKEGNPESFNFPRPMINKKNFDFSFSGLKTAVYYEFKKIKEIDEIENKKCVQENG